MNVKQYTNKRVLLIQPSKLRETFDKESIIVKKQIADLKELVTKWVDDRDFVNHISNKIKSLNTFINYFTSKTIEYETRSETVQLNVEKKWLNYKLNLLKIEIRELRLAFPITNSEDMAKVSQEIHYINCEIEYVDSRIDNLGSYYQKVKKDLRDQIEDVIQNYREDTMRLKTEELAKLGNLYDQIRNAFDDN